MVSSLLPRIMSHSPELAAALRLHLEERAKQGIDEPRSYDGQDASAGMVVALCSALLSLEQVRLEVIDQVTQFNHRGEEVPASYYLALSHLLSLEPVILSAATAAVDLHAGLWNVHLPIGEPGVRP